jgi:hypothetical protein
VEHSHIPSDYGSITPVMPQYPWPWYIRGEAAEEEGRGEIIHSINYIHIHIHIHIHEDLE